MASKTVLAVLAVALLVALAAADPKKHHDKNYLKLDKEKLGELAAGPVVGIRLNKKSTRSVNNHKGIQSYDVIKGARHTRSVLAPVAETQVPASRPKRFFGLHRRPKVVVVHQQYPTVLQPPPQIVYIRKHHRHHHHHRPSFSVHLG